MTDRKNLPAAINQQVAVHIGQRGSLVMRGLVAIQESKALALAKEKDGCSHSVIDGSEESHKKSESDLEQQALEESRKRMAAAKAANRQPQSEDFWRVTRANIGQSGIDQMMRSMPRIEPVSVFYCEAAEQGDAGAQFNLGLKYQFGQGIPQDDEQAVYWICKAAKQGNNEAQKYLESHGVDWRNQDAS